MRVSSCNSFSPAARRIALRNHCSPKISSRVPTTSRSTSSGTTNSAGPSAATTAASATRPATTPVSAERQSRVNPAASMMVNASTASTPQARNTAVTSNQAVIATPRRRPASDHVAEGVAGLGVAGVVAGAEPLPPVGRGAVGEALLVDRAAGLLDRVVADRRRGVQTLLDVLVGDALEDLVTLRVAGTGGVLRPDPGVAVGPQFQHHRQLVGVVRVALLDIAHRRLGTDQVLHVVAVLHAEDPGQRLRPVVLDRVDVQDVAAVQLVGGVLRCALLAERGVVAAVGDRVHAEAAGEQHGQREYDAAQAALAAGDREDQAGRPAAEATAEPADQAAAVDDLADVDVGALVEPHDQPRSIGVAGAGWSVAVGQLVVRAGSGPGAVPGIGSSSAAMVGEMTTLIAAATGMAMTAPTRPSTTPPVSATSNTAAEDRSTVLRNTRGAIR